MTFGEMLRKLREEAGLTQVGLAGRSGVPLRTIQGWEQDYRCPVSLDFLKLIRTLGVSCEVFADTLGSGEVPAAKSAAKKVKGTKKGGK